MASYNRVVLVGNITRDLELRALPSGTSVMDLGLAVNDRRKDQNGNWVEEANFFDITVWGRSAEVLNEYARKGSPILVEGKLKQDVWEQDGQKRSKVKILADRVVLLGSRDGGSVGGGPSQGDGYQQSQGGYSQGGYSQGGRGQGGEYQQRSRQQSQSKYPARQQPPQGGFEGGDDIPF